MKWSFKKPEGPSWPNDDNGEPIAPAYLRHISGGPLDLELSLNLLEAYGIPHVSEYPNNGAFGKLIFGHPPSGMEIFVPETMLEDALNVLSADIVTDNDELNNNEDGKDDEPWELIEEDDENAKDMESVADVGDHDNDDNEEV